MNNSTRIANTALQEQGFVIMSFHPGPKPLPKIGQKIEDPVHGGGGQEVPGPFFVIGTATAEEYLERARKYAPGSKSAIRNARTAIGFFKLVAE